MILSKDQINRYLRHIIIPEISGPGQKKITESKVFIFADTVEEVAPLIQYLAAAGVGYITCSLKERIGYEKLFSTVRDLNEDVFIELANEPLPVGQSHALYSEEFAIRILICEYKNFKDPLINFSKDQDDSKFIPTIVAVNNGWKGSLQTFSNKEAFNQLLSNSLPSALNFIENSVHEKEGFILSACLLGVLTAIECIKLFLNLGTIIDTPLYFDLLSMEFHRLDTNNFNSASTDFLKDNDSRNSLSANFEKAYDTKKLAESKVLIVGTGGLGSPVAYALSSLGIGTLGFVDYDKVEISNLNRQILHSASRIDMPKVESAEVFIKNLNPDVKVVTYNTSLNSDNAMDLIKEYDIIIDALDNFPARYLLNDSCFFANKPLVDAAAVRFYGVIMTILPKRGPCYRCAFPATKEQKGAMRCSEAGVLGPVPGVMGFIQAAEVVKLLLNLGETVSNRILYYDALESDFDTVSMSRSSNCDLCGAHPTITTLVEYNTACENNK